MSIAAAESFRPVRARTSEVLRVNPEPCVYFDEHTVHGALTRDPVDYVTYVRDALIDIADGRATIEMPAKTIFDDGAGLGDFRVMPCVVRTADAARKTVKIVGTNVTERVVPDQITVGKAFVLHPDDNFITHTFECCLLSSARTGVCAVQGMLALAPRTRTLTIIGAGRVGYYAAFYATAMADFEAVIFHDLNRARAEQTAALLAAHRPGVRVEARDRDALAPTDVLVLATTSRSVLYGAEDFPAQLVIALGADTDSQREMCGSLAGAGRVFVDTPHSARVGDLHAWAQEGRIDLAQTVDLFSVLREGTTLRSNERAFYVSTGCALFDNLTIGYILARGA